MGGAGLALRGASALDLGLAASARQTRVPVLLATLALTGLILAAASPLWARAMWQLFGVGAPAHPDVVLLAFVGWAVRPLCCPGSRRRRSPHGIAVASPAEAWDWARPT